MCDIMETINEHLSVIVSKHLDFTATARKNLKLMSIIRERTLALFNEQYTIN